MKAGWLFLAFVLIFFAALFSYKLLEVPPGLLVDESSLGYNATLLARTGRDQNSRLLPIFVLSTENDWRQPVEQYYLALFFKLFGASVFNLRFAGIAVVLASGVLVFLLARNIDGEGLGWVSFITLLTTPLVMIQAHQGQENYWPMFFAAGWMSAIYLWEKKKLVRFLVLAGVFVGLGFYSYKGMRAIAPVWTGISLLYLWFTIGGRDLGKKMLPIAAFLIGVGPFFLAAPLLNRVYPGAVTAGSRWDPPSWDNFFYSYFSNYDLSFLFVKGDEFVLHSTGRHGMFLLPMLPLFVIGVYEALRKRGIWTLVLAAFFFTPLLYGMVNSIHRASRLMALIPSFSLLCGLGWTRLKRGRFAFARMAIVVLASTFVYLDFLKYYWGDYPKFISGMMGTLSVYEDYEVLAREARARNLRVYIEDDIIRSDGDSGRFFASLYLTRNFRIWEGDVPPPGKSILFSIREEIPGMERVEAGTKYHHLQILKTE